MMYISSLPSVPLLVLIAANHIPETDVDLQKWKVLFFMNFIEEGKRHENYYVLLCVKYADITIDIIRL